MEYGRTVMKILQIAPVVEYQDTGNEDHGTWQRIPATEATVYGLGDDNKLYFWGVTSSKRVEHEPDEDGETSHYEKTYGWKPAN